ncbi:DUF5965 family protein [Streptococcus loxodontisalivarius]|uniref:DUF3847 domain-containing protein n=1 Tax=Streptococcus loxodontisalivarius TaxID=1349415 RepID=A0ABS2PQ27_9STRE|nr:DUF5965 family protein [Streptococcus loxodontisalivarius]MBM7642053.1 hypothetical protein [Streptococcus loxodontisalivarius]HEO6695456.1 hypothetical protein [Streptococcus agalactiae]
MSVIERLEEKVSRQREKVLKEQEKLEQYQEQLQNAMFTAFMRRQQASPLGFNQALDQAFGQEEIRNED